MNVIILPNTNTNLSKSIFHLNQTMTDSNQRIFSLSGPHHSAGQQAAWQMMLSNILTVSASKLKFNELQVILRFLPYLSKIGNVHTQCGP
jgi:hypothetical protein